VGEDEDVPRLCAQYQGRNVGFYCTILALPILHSLENEHSKLTCCDMGAGSYLMFETGGGGKSVEQNPAWLRFNVEDVEAAAQQRSDKGVNVTVRHEVWGTVADFTDPDGNRCSLRDEASVCP